MNRLGACIGMCTVVLACSAHRVEVEPTQLGRALFVKEWVYDSQNAGGHGDGLGPLFNDTSCVACHSLGGVGGSGPATKNVELLTQRRLGALGEELGSSTMVLHYFHATDESYPTWRSRNSSRSGLSGIFNPNGVSERNPPALFGAGLIDQIGAQALIAQAARKHDAHPAVSGRVARTPEGRVARFGWKGEVATLSEFVSRACVAELGLDVGDTHQMRFTGGGIRPDEDAPRDLAAGELDALIAYVATLPRPQRAQASGSIRGEHVFERIGCAACHTRRLGAVDGIYSDLLLHDMGRGLTAEAGGYYGVSEQAAAVAGRDHAPTPTEWRTPPLWGLRDSGPYLHDGRARTLDDAIMLHGGEAATIRTDYKKLTPSDRQDLMRFLKSLVAPAASLGRTTWVPET